MDINRYSTDAVEDMLALDDEGNPDEVEDLLTIMDAILDAMSIVSQARRQNCVTARLMRQLSMSMALAASYLDDMTNDQGGQDPNDDGMEV